MTNNQNSSLFTCKIYNKVNQNNQQNQQSQLIPNSSNLQDQNKISFGVNQTQQGNQIPQPQTSLFGNQQSQAQNQSGQNINFFQTTQNNQNQNQQGNSQTPLFGGTFGQAQNQAGQPQSQLFSNQLNQGLNQQNLNQNSLQDTQKKEQNNPGQQQQNSLFDNKQIQSQNQQNQNLNAQNINQLGQNQNQQGQTLTSLFGNQQNTNQNQQIQQSNSLFGNQQNLPQNQTNQTQNSQLGSLLNQTQIQPQGLFGNQQNLSQNQQNQQQQFAFPQNQNQENQQNPQQQQQNSASQFNLLSQGQQQNVQNQQQTNQSGNQQILQPASTQQQITQQENKQNQQQNLQNQQVNQQNPQSQQSVQQGTSLFGQGQNQQSQQPQQGFSLFGQASQQPQQSQIGNSQNQQQSLFGTTQQKPNSLFQTSQPQNQTNSDQAQKDQKIDQKIQIQTGSENNQQQQQQSLNLLNTNQQQNTNQEQKPAQQQQPQNSNLFQNTSSMGFGIGAQQNQPPTNQLFGGLFKNDQKDQQISDQQQKGKQDIIQNQAEQQNILIDKNQSEQKQQNNLTGLFGTNQAQNQQQSIFSTNQDNLVNQNQNIQVNNQQSDAQTKNKQQQDNAQTNINQQNSQNIFQNVLNQKDEKNIQNPVKPQEQNQGLFANKENQNQPQNQNDQNFGQNQKKVNIQQNQAENIKQDSSLFQTGNQQNNVQTEEKQLLINKKISLDQTKNDQKIQNQSQNILNPQNDQQFIFDPQQISHQDSILKICLQSNKNFFDQIKKNNKIALNLLNKKEIQEKVIQMTRSLEFKDSELKELDSLIISSEIKQIIRQQCEMQNFSIKIAINLIQNQQNPSKQNLPQLLQDQNQQERILSLKITYFYIKQNNQQINKLFKHNNFIQNLQNLNLQSLDEQKQQLKILFYYISTIDTNFNIQKQEIPFNQNLKPQIDDIQFLISLKFINVSIVAEYIFQSEEQNIQNLNSYYNKNAQKINEQYKNQYIWNLLIKYFKQIKLDAFKNIQHQELSNRDYLDKILLLIKRSLFQEEKEIYSLLIKDLLTILLQLDPNFEDQDKYVEIFKQLCKCNPQIQKQFWGYDQYEDKGFGKLFKFIQNQYPKNAVNLLKIVSSASSQQFVAQAIDLLQNFKILKNDFIEYRNVWKDLWNEWVVFIKQLVNQNNEKPILIKLPVVQFIKLICQLIYQSPIFFKDIEFNLLNIDRQNNQGYMLSYMLFDTFYYFQKIKQPNYKLLSMIIDCFTSSFQIECLKLVIAKVIQIYGHTIPTQYSHHPFFEVINLIKNESFQNKYQQKIFQSMSSLIVQIYENCDDLRKFFPFQENIMNCQLSQYLYSLHFQEDIWNNQQIQQVIQIFQTSLIYSSTFLQDYLGFIFNYLLPMVNNNKFLPLYQRQIQSDILQLLSLELQQYTQQIERINISNCCFSGVGFDFINSQEIQKLILEVLEIQMPIEQQFVNKIFSHYYNLIEIDPQNEDNQLLQEIYKVVKYALNCLENIVDLIDIFIENQNQQQNIKYIAQLQLVSYFGQIFCFKEKMYYYQEFYKSNQNVQSVKINLILAIALHINMFRQKLDYQIDYSLMKKINAQPNSKSLINYESISINALKVLTKINLLWHHLPQQKQPKLFELFQEISDNKFQLTLQQYIQSQIISNLEDFRDDPHSAIASLEFLISCFENQKQFLNVFLIQQKRVNEFNNQINAKLQNFVNNAVQFLTNNNDEIYKLFLCKLILFISNSQQFQFNQNFQKTDYLQQFFVISYKEMQPSFNYYQLDYNQKDVPGIPDNLNFQRQISMEIQKRFALKELSQYLQKLLLQSQKLPIQEIIQFNLKQYVEYFMSYNFINNQKQNFLLNVYQTLQKNNKQQIQFEYRQQRGCQLLRNDLYKILEANQQGFGRDYLIDTLELFNILNNSDGYQEQCQYAQNQNLLACLIEIDENTFKSILINLNLLLSVNFTDPQLGIFSALISNQEQQLFQKNPSVINPNYNLVIQKHLEYKKIFSQGFLQEILQLIFEKMSFNGDDHQLQINNYAFDFIVYALIQINNEEEQLQLNTLVTNGFQFFAKAMKYASEKEILALNYFLDYLLKIKVKFSQFQDQFKEIIECISQLFKNNFRVLIAVKKIIQIDCFNFIQLFNYDLFQQMLDRVQVGNQEEQILILQILSLISQDKQGIEILLNMNAVYNIMNCNNLNQINIEYYKDSLQLQLFKEMMQFLRNYLIMLKNTSKINVYSQFFKHFIQRIQFVLRLPLKTLEKQDVIQLEYLDELNILLSLIYVIYKDEHFYQSNDNVFELIFHDLSNFTIFLFQYQNIQILPQSNFEKMLEQQNGLSGQNNLFTHQVEYLLLQIQSSFTMILPLCYQNSQILQLFNESSVSYDVNFWEEVQEAILGSIIWIKKLGFKWIQQEKHVRELIKKQKYFIQEGLEWDQSLMLQISVLKRYLRLACIHLEMHAEFRKLYNFIGNTQITQNNIDKICVSIDEIEKLYNKYLQQEQVDKNLQFQKNDESSWSIFQIYKHFLKQELEI